MTIWCLFDSIELFAVRFLRFCLAVTKVFHIFVATKRVSISIIFLSMTCFLLPKIRNVLILNEFQVGMRRVNCALVINETKIA